LLVVLTCDFRFDVGGDVVVVVVVVVVLVVLVVVVVYNYYNLIFAGCKELKKLC